MGAVIARYEYHIDVHLSSLMSYNSHAVISYSYD